MRFLYRGTGADRQETVPPRLPAFIRLERGKECVTTGKGKGAGKARASWTGTDGLRVISLSVLPICLGVGEG